jgi:hypothetical protein
MTIQRRTTRILFRLFSLVILSVATACEPDLADDPIPYIPFTAITIDVNLPAYQSLKTSGYIYLDGGVRGILLHKTSSSQYIAFERNCSYRPNEACATVEMHSSNLYMLDTCCGSSFELPSGNPIGGVAWRPLRKYETSLSGTQLTITDTIVE